MWSCIAGKHDHDRGRTPLGRLLGQLDQAPLSQGKGRKHSRGPNRPAADARNAQRPQADRANDEQGWRESASLPPPLALRSTDDALRRNLAPRRRRQQQSHRRLAPMQTHGAHSQPAPACRRPAQRSLAATRPLWTATPGSIYKDPAAALPAARLAPKAGQIYQRSPIRRRRTTPSS